MNSNKLPHWSITIAIFAMFIIYLLMSLHVGPIFADDAKLQKKYFTMPDVYYVIAEGGLRMRSEANTNATMITLIPYGTRLNSIAQSKHEESISGKSSRWHKVKYKDDKAKEYIGWVFGGFLSNIRLLRKCTALNISSEPFELKESFDSLATTEDPKSDYWHDKIENDMFGGTTILIYNNGKGTYDSWFAQGGGGSFSTPLTWEKVGDNIEAEAILKLSQTKYMKDCSTIFSSSDDGINKCENRRNERWKKKYGNSSEASIHVPLLITFSKKGEILIKTQKQNKDDKDDEVNSVNFISFDASLMKCGY